MAQQIPIGFKCNFTVGGFTDAAGNPTSIDKVTDIRVSDPSKARIVDQAGDLTSAAVAIDGAGAGQVQVDVDVDRTDGVKTLTLLGDFEGLAGEAVAGAISFGTVVPQ